MKKVGVVGVGYVGLTQAVGMAQLGHSVIAYDIDQAKIEKLNKGNSPFFEPGLEEALVDAQSKNLISFSSDADNFINAEYIFLCLPTPQDEDGSADLTYLLEAVSNIRNVLKPNSYLIIKSTVPVNAWKQVEQIVKRDDVFVISNPEFLREGSALFDFHNPDRIVIGATNKELGQIVAELYENIPSTILLTDNTSAELIKYAANSFLAMKLSFVNDIAALSDNLNASSSDVLKGVGLDKRIGNKFLTPGPGWGGSCFPKDVRALVNIADKEKIMMPLLSAALKSNASAQDRVVDKVLKYFNQKTDAKVAILGLAFKANTDDFRNSPAVKIANNLKEKGFEVRCYDPQIKKHATLATFESIHEVVNEADMLLILTEWDDFRQLDPKEISRNMQGRVILDTRHVLNRPTWELHKFRFL